MIEKVFMDNISTKLSNYEADLVFGKSENWEVFRESTSESAHLLGTILRYIALKHCNNPLNEFIPIEATVTRTLSWDKEITICVGEGRSGKVFESSKKWIPLNVAPYPVSQFLSKHSATEVYINPSDKRAVIIVDKITPEWMLDFCSVLFRILTWRYPTGLCEDDKTFFAALSKHDISKINQLIDDKYTTFNLRDLAIKKALNGWENKFKENKINILNNKREDIGMRIRKHESELADCYSKLNSIIFETNAILSALADSIKSSELDNFFLTHKQLHVQGIADIPYSITFSILETLEYYDKDEFLRIYNNPSSYLNKHKDIREIFYNIFVLNKGSFRVESAFSLTDLSALYIFQQRFFRENSLPHPHLHNYGCLGANSTPILEYMKNGDWDLAIEQAIATTKNINFGDIVTLTSFINDIEAAKNNCKCIIADNGTEMTPSEFLQYIRTQEGDVKDV